MSSSATMRPRSGFVRSCLLFLAFAASTVLPTARVVAQNTRTLLAQREAASPAGAEPAGPLAGSQPLPAIVVELKRTSPQQADLDALLLAQSTAGSAQYRRWLTPGEFAARFAPSAAETAAVTSWLEAQGLQVTATSASGMRLLVSGTAQQAAAAFHVALQRLSLVDGSDAIAVEGTPSVPTALANTVRAVNGLTASGPDAMTTIAGAADADTAAVLVADLAKAAAPEELTDVLEQASAQGQSVLVLHADPAALPARALLLALPGDPPVAALAMNSATTARPSWQAVAGLPADGLRETPDAAVASDTTALVGALQAIVAKAGTRQGEVAATFYRLSSVPGVFAHADSTVPAGTWAAADGLGVVDPIALAKAWPYATVSPDSQVLAVSSNVLTHGASLTLTATIKGSSGTPTGNVTFTSAQGGAVSTVALNSSGVATLTTNALAGGQYGFYGQYAGDSTYSAVSTNVDTVTINPENAVISGSAPSTAAVGGSIPATITASSASGVGTPTGIVAVYPYGTNANPGTYTGTLAASSAANTATAAVAVPATNAGTFTFQTNCTTGASFACNTPASFSVTVQKGTPTVTLASTTTTSGATLTATVTSTGTATAAAVPTGSVQFSDGTTVLGSGTVSSTGVATYTGALGSGTTHSLTAVYGGDTNYVTASSAATSSTGTTAAGLTVTLAPTGSIAYGNNATLTATATSTTSTTAAVTGTVTVTVPGTGGGTYTGTLSGTAGTGIGTATVVFPVPAPGSYTLIITCSANITCSSTTVALVTTQGSTVTTLSLPAAPQAGVPIAVSATVANAGSGTGTYSPTGTVNFLSGTKLLGKGTVASGVATANVTFTTATAQTLTAAYSGDTNWAASTSAQTAVTPVPLTANIVLSATTLDPTAGQNVTITAALTSSLSTATVAPTGTITFYDTVNNTVTVLGTVTLLSNDLTAYASFSTTALRTGTHSITAAYIGDPLYSAETSTALGITVGDFTVAFQPASLSLIAGSSGKTTVLVSPVSGFAGTVALSCTPPPNTATTCSISPSTVAAGASAQVTITTTANSSSSSRVLPGDRASRGVEAAAMLGLLSLLAARQRRRATAALFALLLTVMLAAGGCSLGQVDSTNNSSGGSGGVGGGTPTTGTPLGTLSFTVTAASVGLPANVQHTLVLPVTVQ